VSPRTGDVTNVPDAGLGAVPLDWSTDGARLLVSRYEPLDGTLRLFTWNHTNNAWQRVSRGQVGNGGALADGPIRLAWHGPIRAKGAARGGGIFIATDTGDAQLIAGTEGAWLPDVSPDGQSVVFAKPEPHSRYNSTVYLARLGGDEPQPITRGTRPHYSRDGRFIVFQRELSSGESHIWIMRADGGAKRQVTKSSFVEEYPSISPDGRFVVFASTRGDEKESHLFVARVSDGVEQEITHSGQASRPVW
jgi:dipeptidyl aminopeptidase/acylaminoacyl peptidase